MHEVHRVKLYGFCKINASHVFLLLIMAYSFYLRGEREVRN